MSTTKHGPRNLTATYVKQLQPERKRIEVRDTSVRGLVMQVTPAGAKAFYLRTRLRDESRLTMKLGEFPTISLAAAREMCREHLAMVSAGDDPRLVLKGREMKDASEAVTLAVLIGEYQCFAAPKRAMWRSGSRHDRKKPEAQAAIENVFAALLDTPVSKIRAQEIASAAKSYTPISGKTTANGAVSRALAYLRPVFDWAAGRNRFRKLGAGRDQLLAVADVSEVHDPSLDDPSIQGIRDRVLSQTELEAILPALTYPAPSGLRKKMPRDLDYGPAAIKFLFLTMSRREEVEEMRRSDIDELSKTWTKTVKTNPGDPRARGGRRIIVRIPLSDAAMSLLKSLPTYQDGCADSRIFPSSAGGRLGNWQRTAELLYEFTNTGAWTRHDLRSTAATILQQLGVKPNVIDALLCHAQPRYSEALSGSAGHYIFPERIIESGPDYGRDAADTLASALDHIEAMASVRKANGPTAGNKGYESGGHPAHGVTQVRRARSPWAD